MRVTIRAYEHTGFVRGEVYVRVSGAVEKSSSG